MQVIHYMEKKKKVILHDIEYSVGGPKTVLAGIENSPLKDVYDFVRLPQKEGCGFSLLKAIRFVNRYRKLIDAQKADSIYVCGLQYVGFLMTLAAKMSNVRKVVVSVHGSDWDNPNGTMRKWILMHIIEPLTVKMADSVFTVCESAQLIVKALKASPKHNAGVVYNTFPNFDINKIEKGKIRKELNIASDKIVVSVIGRVVRAKGHQYIIDAIKKLHDNRYVFLVAGTGTYCDIYQHECAQEMANGSLYLLGVRNDIKEILCDTDIFLFATLNENHSMALLEAVNMHCAALVTDVGGNPEIIEDKVSGILVPPRNSDAIVSGLYKLADADLRNKYAQNAYNYAKEKFSVENTYGKLGKILNPDI